MDKVLITRFSSLGDVALLVPVVYSVALANPTVRFTVLTRNEFASLFNNLNINVTVRGVDLKKEQKGILGILKIIWKMKKRNYTHFADMHNVLRTKLIYHLSPELKRAKIDKGRKEKKQIIKTKDTSKALPHATMRYMKVFKDLGLKVPDMQFDNIFEFKSRNFDIIADKVPAKQGRWIGIAPFAKHQTKMYPIEQLEELIKKLSELKDVSVFLFGGGRKETKIMNDLCQKYPNTIKEYKQMRLSKELIFMSYLDVMISMDSANMHLASLVEVPVVSIWGATHPSLGFLGYKQKLDNAIIAEDIDCQPCSVFGQKKCIQKGDDEYKCLKEIRPKEIYDKVLKVLDEKE